MFVVVLHFHSAALIIHTSVPIRIHLPCSQWKSLVPGRMQFLKCNANIPSDLAEAKLNSSNDYCSSLFSPLPPLWCAHKREDLQVQKDHSSIVLSLFERGVVFPAFSVLYSCRPAEPEPDGRVPFHRRAIQPKHLPGNGWGLFTETKHRPALCDTVTNGFSVW